MKHLLLVFIIALATALQAPGAGSAPVVTPDEPAAKPEKPAAKPEKPAAKPEKPAAKQEKPAPKQESPPVAAYNQGVELMQEKQFSQAQKKFEQAVKLDPSFAEAYNNLAFTLRKQGTANYQKSLTLYNKAIELKPKLAEAYMYRGVLYTQMGRKADAQADLATLKKLNSALAKELEEFFETGKEEDYLYGAAKKK
jgi:tetratricopeptide (TPR) repeat protein